MPTSINDVRYAVHAALENAFPTIPLTGDSIPQVITQPMFYVKLLESDHVQELDRRYRRYLHFDVHYFDQNLSEMYEVAERLTSVLQVITASNKTLRGNNMRVQIVDEILHFLVGFTFLVWQERSVTPTMQNLEQEGYINERK